LTLKIDFAKVSLVFACIGGLVYFNALGNPFHYDDHHSIKHNPHIRSLGNLGRYFTDLQTFSVEQRGTMFRPLLLASYAVNYALHGQEVRGYRLTNLFLHLLCSTLVFALVFHLTGKGKISTAAGFIFLVHPTHGELINYISSRSDLLVSCFYLGAFLLIIQGNRKASVGGYVAYAAGLLSKSIAITLPVMVGGFELGKDGWKPVKNNWVKYVFIGGISLIYLAVITANRFLGSSLAKVPRPLDEQAWTQLKAYVYYLWLFAMPSRLNIEHQFSVSQTLWHPVSLLAGLFLLSICFFAICGRKWVAALGFFWFIVTLLPASLVPLNILVSERRMYLASAGLVIAAAWAWEQMARRDWRRTAAIGCLLGLVFAYLSFQRNQVWASHIDLWEDAVQKAPLMVRPRVNLALAYNKKGREEAALEELQTALLIEPDFADAWVELGNIQHQREALDAAEEAYRKALEYSPSLEGVYYNLGNISLQRGKPAEAIAYYQETLRRNPDFSMAYNNLGQAYEAEGRLEEALQQYREALEANPDSPQAWFNLAAGLERTGDLVQARQAYQKAYQLLTADSDFPNNVQYQEFARKAQAGFLRLRGNERID